MYLFFAHRHSDIKDIFGAATAITEFLGISLKIQVADSMDRFSKTKFRGTLQRSSRWSLISKGDICEGKLKMFCPLFVEHQSKDLIKSSICSYIDCTGGDLTHESLSH